MSGCLSPSAQGDKRLCAAHKFKLLRARCCNSLRFAKPCKSLACGAPREADPLVIEPQENYGMVDVRTVKKPGKIYIVKPGLPFGVVTTVNKHEKCYGMATAEEK